jgi:hypothetical protein
MNPFNRSNPNLSSSDRTRDYKSKYIYAVAKRNFQVGKHCKGNNMRYYKNGTVRSTISYKMHNDLARGDVLYNDCNGKGNLCGGIDKSALSQIRMYNSSVSEFYGGSSLAQRLNNVRQSISLPFIQSDISGVWSTSSTDINKSDLSGGTMLPGSDPSANMPYGYIDNLIKIPRNLDGSGVIVDPSNILFSANNCGQFKYLDHSKLKTTIVIRGAINLSNAVPTDINPFPPFVSAKDCTDNSYNLLVGSFIQLADIIDASPVLISEGICFGTIVKLCCLGKKFDIPWFDMHVELYNTEQYDLLTKIVNYEPYSAGILYPVLEAGTYVWSNFPAFGYLIYSKNTTQDITSITYDGFIESVRIYQGTCQENQTTGNKTKGNYMHCLENGTRKINFT